MTWVKISINFEAVSKKLHQISFKKSAYYWKPHALGVPCSGILVVLSMSPYNFVKRSLITLPLPRSSENSLKGQGLLKLKDCLQLPFIVKK